MSAAADQRGRILNPKQENAMQSLIYKTVALSGKFAPFIRAVCFADAEIRAAIAAKTLRARGHDCELRALPGGIPASEFDPPWASDYAAVSDAPNRARTHAPRAASPALVPVEDMRAILRALA